MLTKTTTKTQMWDDSCWKNDNATKLKEKKIGSCNHGAVNFKQQQPPLPKKKKDGENGGRCPSLQIFYLISSLPPPTSTL